MVGTSFDLSHGMSHHAEFPLMIWSKCLRSKNLDGGHPNPSIVSEHLVSWICEVDLPHFAWSSVRIRSWKLEVNQLGQSNGSVTDGPAECDNHPSTMGQRTQLRCHKFALGNVWAETLKLAM